MPPPNVHNVSRCFGSLSVVARNVLDEFSNPLRRPTVAMMLRAAIATLTLAVVLPTAHAQAPSPAGASDATPPTASTTAAATEGAEKKRRLRFRDEKNACAPGALGEADIRATLTAKPAATEQPKRSDK
jgi:hypothetical protein